jgi:hypothetical protein
MIHAFSFTCNRDAELSELMVTTFLKYCLNRDISVSNTDTIEAYKSYGNGSGWQASMMKLKGMSDVIKTKDVQDDDFILSVDSDVVFCSPEVFKYADLAYGIIGTKHRPEFHTHFQSWSHMSGALIFFRGDIAKKMVELSEETLNNIRFQHFKPYNLTENEDVVLSYLAKYVGAEWFDLGIVPDLTSGDFERDVLAFSRRDWISSGITNEFYEYQKNKKYLKSFYHLNYCPTQFLGESIDGKWRIPSVLKVKGIEL